MALNPSLGSMDSEYDLGSTRSDLSLAEDPSPHGGMPTAMPVSQADPTFPCLKPSNPSPQALSSEEHKAHNHSSVSFREGRRASDTSLTQGANFSWMLAIYRFCIVLLLLSHLMLLLKPICVRLYEKPCCASIS